MSIDPSSVSSFWNFVDVVRSTCTDCENSEKMFYSILVELFAMIYQQPTNSACVRADASRSIFTARSGSRQKNLYLFGKE